MHVHENCALIMSIIGDISRKQRFKLAANFSIIVYRFIFVFEAFRSFHKEKKRAKNKKNRINL
jgi:hypothetical protein